MRLSALVVIAACGRVHFDPRPDARIPYSGPNRVFVTSAMMTGNLGGFAGADATCQQTADGVDLDGEFVALLFGSQTNPSLRLAGSRGWVNLAGKPVADLPTDFDDATTINPIGYDEHGTRIVGAAHLGEGALATCDEWTSDTGIGSVSYASESMWAQTPKNGGCRAYHLYCAERGRDVPVTPNVGDGRIAFLTANDFVPTSGLAGADAQCNSEATAAGLPGMYRAFLGSSAGGPETRFSTAGPPWRRVDGVIIGEPTALLSTDPTTHLESFVTRTASGAPWQVEHVWTGVNDVHCSDWQTESGDGLVGGPGHTRIGFLRIHIPWPCALAKPIICLEL